MPRTIRGFPFACCVLAATAVSVDAAEPLRWKFEPGQQFRYQLVQASTITMNVAADVRRETTTSQTVDMTWTVEEVNAEGTARIKHDVQRVRMGMTAPLGQGYEFDTASPEPPTGLAATIAPVFGAMVEADYHVTMTARGEIEDVDAPAELLEAIKNLPGAGGGLAAGDEAIRQMAMQLSLALPEGPLEPGASWSTTTEAEATLLGAQKAVTTYRYRGPQQADGKLLELFEPTIDITAGDDAAGAVSIKASSGETGGLVTFNRTAGRLEGSVVDQQLTLEITTAGQRVVGEIKQRAEVRFGDAILVEEPSGETAAEPAAL